MESRRWDRRGEEYVGCVVGCVEAKRRERWRERRSVGVRWARRDERADYRVKAISGSL